MFFLLSVENILENIATRISGLDSKVVALDSKVVALDSKVVALDSRVVALDNKVVALESKVVGLDSKVVALDSRVVALDSKVIALDSMVVSLDSKVDLFMQKVESDHRLLRETLDTLNDSVSNLSVCLQQHKEQTTAELTLLQTSLNSTNSKLNSLMATATQLSFDHQEIQTNISDMECMDAQQNLQPHQNLHVNLTHQLEMIKDGIDSPPVYSCGGTGGWRRVVYLDMTGPNTTCPSGWNMTEMCQRTCGRKSTGSRTCSSATFPVIGGEYSRVCGRIRAYQWGQTLGFHMYYRGGVMTIVELMLVV